MNQIVPRLPRLTVSKPFAVLSIQAVFTLAAFGSESDSRPNLVAAVTSNQSLALDEGHPTETAVAVGPEWMPDPIETAPRGPSNAQEATVIISSTPADTAEGSRTVKKTRNGFRDSSFAGEQSTPWYRNGLGSLVVVLAVIGGLYVAARRWLPSVRTSDQGALRVVARASLTPKHAVTLVQLGRRLILVGISPGGMQTLCEIGDETESSELLNLVPSGRRQAAERFSEMLDHESVGFMSRLDGSKSDPATLNLSAASGRSPLADFLKRLRTARV